ncbi:hypothetical protein DY000_02050272 [Brassica cretica]|uniref:Uncharacterized protein n=1 Tax=Brassica cretica TaxID=69181 RepID=A0ABQ7EU41_BRACR|nr:hypothetical protein DY000_02050272 [Brassica cretica]
MRNPSGSTTPANANNIINEAGITAEKGVVEETNDDDADVNLESKQNADVLSDIDAPAVETNPHLQDSVFKGRKMPGRMGAEQRTVKNVWVYKIDPARNLIWVRGQVPGAEGNFVFIKDAFYKKPDISKLPFPTYLAPEDEDLSELEPLVADLGEVDPFMLAE